MKVKPLREEKDNIVLALEGELTIYHVKYLKEKFLNFANKYQGIALDLKNVSQIDSAGFQLLLLFKKYQLARKGKLKLLNHSLPVLKMFDLYGAIGIFGDKIKIPQEEKKHLKLAYGINRRLPFGSS